MKDKAIEFFFTLASFEEESHLTMQIVYSDKISS